MLKKMQAIRAKSSGFRYKGNNESHPILSLLACLALLFLFAGGLVSIPSSAASSTQYHNVQVFLDTQTQGGSAYTLVAYESNGTLVSSIQSNYPAFSLELPSGTFLFAASVVNKSSSWWYYSTSEYGYALEQISSDEAITIQTQSLANIPTSKVTIEAKFVNGTAMPGANLYASVIGMTYWSSMYNDQGLALWNQTQANGIATLTIPRLPIEVTAWNWIQVNLPSNETTVEKNIGGQEINVTVYWQPMYVGLSGSALLIPPQDSAQITMYANQQPNYWLYPLGAEYGAASTAGVNGYLGTGSLSSAPSPLPSQVASSRQEFSPGGPIPNTGAPPQYLPPTQIPNIVPVSSQDTLSNDLLIAAIIAATGIACASLFAVVLGRRHSKMTIA